MSSPDPFSLFQLSSPGEVRENLGQWLRNLRQRQEWTLPMLASRSGVPVSTLSRLEREGHGSVDAVLRVFQALGILDEVDRTLRERLRLSTLPGDLEALEKEPPTRQRVRPRKQKAASA